MGTLFPCTCSNITHVAGAEPVDKYYPRFKAFSAEALSAPSLTAAEALIAPNLEASLQQLGPSPETGAEILSAYDAQASLHRLQV